MGSAVHHAHVIPDTVLQKQRPDIGLSFHIVSDGEFLPVEYGKHVIPPTKTWLAVRNAIIEKSRPMPTQKAQPGILCRADGVTTRSARGQTPGVPQTS